MPFYLTTAIDYSNGDPHLGHALEKVGADCHRPLPAAAGGRGALPDGDGRALPGGHPGGRARAGIRRRPGWIGWPSASRPSGAGSSAATTTGSAPPSHGIARPSPSSSGGSSSAIPDDLYVADYEGLYCTGCEEFKQPAQIVNGHCIEHPSLELVPTKERNHFFRLSRYRDAVLRPDPQRRVPGRAGDPAQRGRAAARGRAAGHLGVPPPARPGAFPSPAIRSRRCTSGSTR